MTLTFVPHPDGSWRAQGLRRHYRIVHARDALRTKYRVFQSNAHARESGTHAIAGLHETLEAAIAWCEESEREDPPTSAALERKQNR
jgi:hypothetical protein